MKTLSVKYLMSTQADKRWSDFELPIAVADQRGQLYLITAGEVEDDDDGDSVFDTNYFIANLFTGDQDTEGFESVEALIQDYASIGTELQPVKMDMIVNEFLKASM